MGKKLNNKKSTTLMIISLKKNVGLPIPSKILFRMIQPMISQS